MQDRRKVPHCESSVESRMYCRQIDSPKRQKPCDCIHTSQPFFGAHKKSAAKEAIPHGWIVNDLLRRRTKMEKCALKDKLLQAVDLQIRQYS